MVYKGFVGQTFRFASFGSRGFSPVICITTLKGLLLRLYYSFQKVLICGNPCKSVAEFRAFLAHPLRWAKSRPLKDGRSAFVEILYTVIS